MTKGSSKTVVGTIQDSGEATGQSSRLLGATFLALGAAVGLHLDTTALSPALAEQRTPTPAPQRTTDPRCSGTTAKTACQKWAEATDYVHSRQIELENYKPPTTSEQQKEMILQRLNSGGGTSAPGSNPTPTNLNSGGK